jgi:iron-sulfur cluster insertion protein
MIVQITEKAANRIATLCENEGKYAVSLNIKGGGCAGFEYEWGFMDEAEVDEMDDVNEAGTGRLVVGKESVMFLFGSKVDFKDDMFGSMFTVENPGAASSCGCGTSFSYDFDRMDGPWD